MRNPCECCKKKTKFIRQMNGNFKHSMIIPEKFLSHFIGKTSGTIKLEAPNGNIYEVEVVKKMNKPLLHSGWEAFVNDNHIEENDILSFRCFGSSCFEVTIFSYSGWEKVLCNAETNNASDVQKTIPYCIDISSSSSDHTQPSASEATDECERANSRRRGKPAQSPVIISSPSEELSEENSELESFQSDDSRMVLNTNYVVSGKYKFTEDQETKIVALIGKIQPEICVLVAEMKKTNVKTHPDLVICKKYALAHFPQETVYITLNLPGKSKDWLCKFCIRDCSRNLYMGNFIHENNIRVGDICIFQPMTKAESRNFTVTVHLLRKGSTAHPSGGGNGVDSNHGKHQKRSTDSVDISGNPHNDTTQSSGEKRHRSCQRGSSRYRRKIAKTASTSSSSEESGEHSPAENESFKSDDIQTAPGPDYVLSPGSCPSEEQMEQIVMLLREIQPKTPAFVAVMRKKNVQLPSPFLEITKEYAATHIPRGSASVTLKRQNKSKKWHPRYMEKDGRIYMLRGHWLDFVLDNGVMEGDICLLVPTKGGKRFMFMVHLLRAQATHSRGGPGVQRASSRHGRTNPKMASAVHAKEDPFDGKNENVPSKSNRHGVLHQSLETEDYDGPSEPSYILPHMTSLSASEKKIVEEKVRAIKSEVPLYVAVMNRWNVGARTKETMLLELSARYAAAHLPHSKQTVVLECRGHIWQTEMKVNKTANTTRWYLRQGWSKFVRANRLRLGNIVLFQLKKDERKLITMAVHII